MAILEFDQDVLKAKLENLLLSWFCQINGENDSSKRSRRKKVDWC